MSMEHKAYVFDTKKFTLEVSDLLFCAGLSNDMHMIKGFIEQNAEYSILGNPITWNNFRINPGCCGLGLVNGDDIDQIYKVLSNLNQDFQSLDLDDNIDDEELSTAFDDLITLYVTALENGRGIMFTF